MDEYLLSIIIPHYNIPDLLDCLIHSIPRREEIQIIIVDDHSNQEIEKLERVINNPDYKNLEFYHNSIDHNGAGICRNIGLEHAKGKWVIFADADDHFTNGWFERLAPYFSSDYQMVYYSHTSIYETGEPAERHLYVKSIVEAYCENPCYENQICLRYGMPAALAAMYQRAFLNKIHARFDDVLTEEDKMFILTCGDNVENFACIPEPLYCVLARKGSLTTSKQSFERFDRHQRMAIKRAGILYRKLDAEEIEALGLETVGLQVLYTTIMEGYGLRQAVEYRKLEKENGVPLMLRFEPLKLSKKLVFSIKERRKGQQ